MATASAEDRRDFRDGATGDDFYTLMMFAKRASVFALRDRDAARIREGLTAIAMIDVARVDERDVR